MEPSNLRRLRLAAEATWAEVRRLEAAEHRHHNPVAIAAAIRAADRADRRAWTLYRKAFNAALAA